MIRLSIRATAADAELVLAALLELAPGGFEEVDGDDLVHVLDLPAPSAALGTKVDVPTLDGDEELTIPAGTQPGSVFTLRGKGMPSLRRGKRGDQRIVLNVLIPRNLTKDQRAMLEEFQSTLGEHNLPKDGDSHESLFSRVRRAFG